MKLIDKDVLVAEIEKCYNECLKRAKITDPDYWNGKADAYRNALVILNGTLEVKEVDLDGERRKYLTEHFNVYKGGILQSKRSNLPLDTYDVIKIAKHFFELGLQVSNPITAADKGTA